MAFLIGLLFILLAPALAFAQELQLPEPGSIPQAVAGEAAAAEPAGGALEAAETPAEPAESASVPAEDADTLQAPNPLRLEEVVRVQRVAGGLYLLQGKGGNIAASVGPDGLLLVDSGCTSDTAKVRDALLALGGGEVKYIINTHWHRDHTGGNTALGAAATIIAQRAVRPRLEGADYPAQSLPDVEFDGLKELRFNGEDIRILHASGGHTDGDSVVYFVQSNILHLGDLFFAGRFPLVDVEGGGGVENYIANVRAIVGQVSEDVRIIPGHGPLSSMQDLLDYLEMLVVTRDVVQKQRSEGFPLSQILARGLPQPWPTWGWEGLPEEAYIKMLYRSLDTAPSSMPVPAADAALLPLLSAQE